MIEIERERVNDTGWFMSLFGSFGFAALLLAALGIYGVVAYSVTQRTREIGLRMTLGATPHAIMLQISMGVLRATGVGLGLGLVAAIAMGMLLRAVLFGVPPADPATLAAVLVGFFVVAVLAALIPARRAARLHPLEAMRG
jgi:ABC-type antimicrobial peptide transport system permease subunit